MDRIFKKQSDDYANWVMNLLEENANLHRRIKCLEMQLNGKEAAIEEARLLNIAETIISELGHTKSNEQDDKE